MICQNFMIFFGKRIIFSLKLKRNAKNSRKKLKEKLNIWEDLSSPTLPSGVKKSLPRNTEQLTESDYSKTSKWYW